MGARGDKREAIIDAAVRVFARSGFHQSRVSDIAREAGVADGTIYLYFRHKEDILIAIFEEKMAAVIVSLKAALDPLSSPDEKLRCFIDFHLTQMSRNRALAEILQVELRLSNKFMKEYVPVRLTEYLDIIADIIEEGQQGGIFRRELNASMLKRAIFGALDELAMHWVLTRGRKPDLQESATQLVDVFLRGLSISGAPRDATLNQVDSSVLNQVGSNASVATPTGGRT